MINKELRLHFLVAGQHYVIAFDDTDTDYQWMLPSHGRFFQKNPEGEPVFTLEVGDGRVKDDMDGLEEVGHFPSGDSSYDVYRLQEGGFKIRIVDLQGVTVCVFSTSARFERCEATLFGNLEQRRFGLQNCVMVCYAFCGAHHGVLMMHASVVRHGGRGYLCQGKSGTGKSTHTRLWLTHIPGCELLNDDNPAIRLMPDGEARVYGTPWSGKTPCYKQESAPVGGFLRLHQAPHNKIRQLQPLEAFASILSSCSTMIWDEPSYNGICQTISGICRVAKAYDMECLPDEDAARTSHRMMCGCEI